MEMPWPSYINILGIIPINIIAASSFSITYMGHKHGLKTTWASLRPIIVPSHLETYRTRISNFFKFREGFIELAHMEGIGTPWLRPFERRGPLKSFLQFLGTDSLKAGPFEFSEPQPQAAELEFGTKYSSAWIKIFDVNIKGSGFIRVWDYSPRIITTKMLDEIFILLKRYCKKRIR